MRSGSQKWLPLFLPSSTPCISPAVCPADERTHGRVLMKVAASMPSRSLGAARALRSSSAVSVVELRRRLARPARRAARPDESSRCEPRRASEPEPEKQPVSLRAPESSEPRRGALSRPTPATSSMDSERTAGCTCPSMPEPRRERLTRSRAAAEPLPAPEP